MGKTKLFEPRFDPGLNGPVTDVDIAGEGPDESFPVGVVGFAADAEFAGW